MNHIFVQCFVYRPKNSDVSICSTIIYICFINTFNKKMNGYSEGLSDGAGLNQYIQYLYTTFGTYPTS